MKRSQKQLELVKRLGSKNKKDQKAASDAFAAFMSAPMLQVIAQAPTLSKVFGTPHEEHNIRLRRRVEQLRAEVDSLRKIIGD